MVDYLNEGGEGGGSGGDDGEVHHSDQLVSVFRGWRPSRRPAAAAGARQTTGPSA